MGSACGEIHFIENKTKGGGAKELNVVLTPGKLATMSKFSYET